MAGDRKLLLGREDSQPRERTIVRWALHENRLGQIHLPREALHKLPRQAVTVGHDRQAIAGERLRGENIELVQASLQITLRACWAIAPIRSVPILPRFSRFSRFPCSEWSWARAGQFGTLAPPRACARRPAAR